MNTEQATLKDRRLSHRAEVQHLVPGSLIDQSTGRYLSGLLVDVSRHGLGLKTRVPVLPGTDLCLQTLTGAIRLHVTWSQNKSTRGSYACGAVTSDENIDLEVMLSSFIQ